MRKKNRPHPEVELNLTAMLDMAFQLLAFFILTFKPSPVEGELAMRLPSPNAVLTKPAKAPEKNDGPGDEMMEDTKSMEITLLSHDDGELKSMQIGEGGITLKGAGPGALAKLDSRLKDSFGKGTPYDQIVLKVAAKLKYDELMKVMDVCLRQKLPDGKQLEKIGFVQLPE